MPSSSVILLLETKGSCPQSPPLIIFLSYFCSSVFRVKIPWLVKHVGCIELLIRKTRAASSGWRGEFLLDIFFLLLTPSAFFSAFSPSSFLPTSPGFSEAKQVINTPCTHPCVCQIMPFRFWVQKLWSPDVTSLGASNSPERSPGPVEIRILHLQVEGSLAERKQFATGSENGPEPVRQHCVPLFTPAFLCSEIPLLDTKPFIPSLERSPGCQLNLKEMTHCEQLSFLDS